MERDRPKLIRVVVSIHMYIYSGYNYGKRINLTCLRQVDLLRRYSIYLYVVLIKVDLTVK